MPAKWVKDIHNWEKEYLDIARNDLSKQQIELLEGRDLKAHEGMIYGQMYNEWKKRKEV